MSMLAQERQNLCLSKPSNTPGLIKLPQIVPHIRRNGLNHNQPYILNLGKLVENALQISKDDHTLKHRRQVIKVGNSQANENEPTVAKIRFKKKNISKALPYKGLLQNVALSKKKISPLKRNILKARKEKLEASNNDVSTSTARHCEIELEITKTCDVLVDTLAQLITNLVMNDALEVAKQLSPYKGSDSKLVNSQKLENQSEAKSKDRHKKERVKKEKSAGSSGKKRGDHGPPVTSLIDFVTGRSNVSIKSLHTNPNAFGGSRPKYSNNQSHPTTTTTKFKSECPELEESIGELNRLNTLKREAALKGPGCCAPKSELELALRSRADRSLLESYLLENGGCHVTTPPTSSSAAARGLGEACCTSLLLRACADIKASTHKPKFRDYCDHYVEKELSCAAVDLVTTLLNFYNRKLGQNPDKGVRQIDQTFIYYDRMKVWK